MSDQIAFVRRSLADKRLRILQPLAYVLLGHWRDQILQPLVSMDRFEHLQRLFVNGINLSCRLYRL